jgi:hypothetical protein
MYAIPRTLTDKFAQAYAGERIGFSAQQITQYFTRYSNLVKPFDHYGVNPTREHLFIESVYALTPKQQYYALNDLTWTAYPSKYPYPNQDVREKLREELHVFISPDPIGLRFSQIRETAFREDWAACLTRLQVDPASTITAARTLLETLLRTIIVERGVQPDCSGELGRLLRQAQEVVGFDRNARQAAHQVLSGLASVVNGLAALSNYAGDRHGLVQGQTIDDPGLAQLCVHAAGAIGIAFIELHLFGTAKAAQKLVQADGLPGAPEIKR